MGNLLRVRTVFTGVAGAPWYSNMYFNQATSTGGAAEVVGAVGAFWTAIRLQMLTGTQITVEGTVPVINEINGKIVDELSTPALSAAGGTGVEPLPFATQALVKWNTAGFVNGKRVTGRTFIPSLLEVDNQNGNPSTGLRNTIDAAAAALIADTGNEFGIWARPFDDKAGVKPHRDGSFHGCTTAVTWTKWAVLRSRRD